jgi:hypothetical protein
MPTMPARQQAAKSTIDRLLPQCDRFYVHLDGFSSIPAWLPSEVRSFIYPQRSGPGIRFSELPQEDYVLFVDDDLLHPVDYVMRTVNTLKRLGPRVAIAFHASWWPPKTAPQYRHRKTIGYWDAIPHDQTVTYVGSGTLALRTADLCSVERLVPDQFRFEDDVWISAALARAGIRCVRPTTSKNWIGQTKAGDHGLWSEASKDGFKQRDACIKRALELGGWKLAPD